MLLWLPLFAGNALASSVAMQMPSGHCQDESMQMADMHGKDMGDMNHTSDQNMPTGNACGVCHLACTAYLAVPTLASPIVNSAERDATPYQFSFISFSSAPLLPPPLAHI